jgi:putative PEP-CTERM system histidine kinase
VQSVELYGFTLSRESLLTGERKSRFLGYTGMNTSFILAISGAACCGIVALIAVSRKGDGLSKGLFFLGMVLLGIRSAVLALVVDAASSERVVHWQNIEFFADALIPGIWLLFSLTYARGNYKAFLKQWRFILFAAFAAGLLLVFGFRQELIFSANQIESSHDWMMRLGLGGFLLNLLLLLGTVAILMNLEKTYRAAVGTMRWRIKFMILGLGLIFAVRAYISSQALLYHAVNTSLNVLDAGAVVLGSLMIVRSLLREGHFDVDVYPAQPMLSNSITVFVAGMYLFIVGVLAKIVTFLGGDASFTLKAFVVLLALVALALVILSDRVRLRARRFVSRHFQRPFYDYRMVWRKFTECTARRVERDDLCDGVVKLMSDIFQALSVTIWLTNDSLDKLTLAASTSLTGPKAEDLELGAAEISKVISALRGCQDPIDLDASTESWAATLKRLQPDEFHKGGNRICVPLMASGEFLGMMMLGDRVEGLSFSVQDFDLLRSISDQVAANLLNIKLSQRLSQAKQLEAFQAMSAFFVHDLKNTASTLSLMLQNLPTHFNDPRFREDALRGISKTVTHINELIRRLSLLRQELTVRLVESDLNTSVTEALTSVELGSSIEIFKELRPLPKIHLDPAHMQNVVMNLIFNARDAMSSGGQIRVETDGHNGWVVLSVSDTGCGMNAEFIQRSLFRPFQTTKKQGIGIGMFQCKMIVEAHRGKIEVQSEVAKGTTFRIFLPVPI